MNKTPLNGGEGESEHYMRGGRMKLHGEEVKFWDYGKHVLNGYQQSGDVHGKYFGTWLRQCDDGKVIIISFGDETKRYWLQMDNCFHGNYATPEMAALKAEALLSANAN